MHFCSTIEEWNCTKKRKLTIKSLKGTAKRVVQVVEGHCARSIEPVLGIIQKGLKRVKRVSMAIAGDEEAECFVQVKEFKRTFSLGRLEVKVQMGKPESDLRSG